MRRDEDSDDGRRFRHEAFLHHGEADFVRGAASFVREGFSADEPVFVALPSERLELVPDELGDDGGKIEYLDMARLGHNPGRVISAWSDFVTDNEVPGGSLRGISDPLWPGASEDVEDWRQNEALFNIAFGSTRLRLLCPYDATAASPEDLNWVNRTHHLLVDREGERPSDEYVEDDGRWVLEGELPEPRVEIAELSFGDRSLGKLRLVVVREARAVGLDESTVADFVLAVNEIATNSVRHGGGSGVLRTWADEIALTCEVKDAGVISEPLIGRCRPDRTEDRGRGLWLANHLCDLVQIRSGPAGTTVRLRMLRADT